MVEQASPSAPKSADRIDGAMMAGGGMVKEVNARAGYRYRNRAAVDSLTRFLYTARLCKDFGAHVSDAWWGIKIRGFSG